MLVAVGTTYAVDRYLSTSATGTAAFRLLDLSWRVFAPAGALMIAVSLALRVLTTGADRTFYARHFATGLALLGLGLVFMITGESLLVWLDDSFGPTGRAGAALIGVVARAVSLCAIPLGVAFLATLPLVALGASGRYSDEATAARQRSQDY